MRSLLITLFFALGLNTSVFGQVSSPYWNAGTQSDMPSADIRAVPEAHAGAVRSYWSYQQSLTDLNNAIRLATVQMERQPEYLKALAEDKQAYDDMQKIRIQTLSVLKNNPEYAARKELAEKVSQQIADEAFKVKPDQTKIQGMAQFKLQLTTENSKLESAELQKSKEFFEATQKMLVCARKLEEIRQTQALAVTTDQNLVALRQQVASARIDRLVAGAYYESTIDARNIALDYSRFYRRIDMYHGYGYGNYGGYGRYYR